MAAGAAGNAKVRLDGETVLIEEMMQPVVEGDAHGPERTLMAALLFDGIQAYMSYMCATNAEQRTKYREAYSWLHSTDTEYVFSFLNVCDGLGIDPHFLRIGVASACGAQLTERKRARRNF